MLQYTPQAEIHSQPVVCTGFGPGPASAVEA